MSMDFLKSLYFELLSYFIPQKISYRIEGKCNKCGECCRQIRCYGLKNEKDLKLMQFFFPSYKHLYIKYGVKTDCFHAFYFTRLS